MTLFPFLVQYDYNIEKHCDYYRTIVFKLQTALHDPCEMHNIPKIINEILKIKQFLKRMKYPGF